MQNLNRLLRILSAVSNAKAFLEVQAEFGAFDSYIWQFVDGKPIRNAWRSLSELPATTDEAERMSKDLKKRGWRFVGPTTVYAFMQAMGLLNDHEESCSIRAKVAKARKRFERPG